MGRHTVFGRIRPLPPWGLWLGLLFPLTIGFGELPTYFGYAMPRLLPFLMIGHAMIDVGTWPVYFTLSLRARAPDAA